MPQRPAYSDEYELAGRDSYDSDDIYGGADFQSQLFFDLDEADFQSRGETSPSYIRQRTSVTWKLLSSINPLRLKNIFVRDAHSRTHLKLPRRPRLGYHKPSVRSFCSCYAFVGILLAVVLSIALLLEPSYTKPPAHYQSLRARIESSEDYGRANPENQKIFIAASIYDEGGHLLGGAWGEAVLKLINMLGNRNVFLSIYENTSGEGGQVAQFKFERRVQCQYSMVLEDSPPLEELPRIRLPDGSERTKRIAYLAEVRNRALMPLDEHPEIKYDKLLYLNDVAFDPIEAAQLLLSTNMDEHGNTAYLAACAVDFINPFKFYDTFATRDLEGYSMGVPFFPWFANTGSGGSRQDVLAGKDAVRVKSCWGGMVAFDATPFQANPPLRFRAAPDTYWDASECCLIHADLLDQSTFNEDGDYVGVYMNPFVRVAYSNTTLPWIRRVQRVERLFTIPQNLINHLVGLPWFNPRRTEVVGSQVKEEVWVEDESLKAGGSFQKEFREATVGGYCGIRTLQLIKESQREREKNWETMRVPPG